MNKEEFKKITKYLDKMVILHQTTGEPINKDLDISIRLSVAYEDLEQQNQKYKEAIDKAINNSQYWIDYYTRLNSDERIALRLQENIDILKEAE